MTNGLTLVATVLLMLFYVCTYVLKKRVPVLAAIGLSLLTIGMLLDELHPIYTITTGLSALASWWGAKPP